MKILNLTGVLPSPAKETDNDVLLVIAEKHLSMHGGEHNFILFLPYVNKALSKISVLWNKYFKLRKLGTYTIEHYHIDVLSMLTLKIDWLRQALFYISYIANKRKLLNIIKAGRPAVIHAHNVLGCAYIAKKLSAVTKIPYVITARELKYSRFDFVRDNIAKSGAVICISYEQKRCFESLNINTPHYLLPHGIDEVFFKDRLHNKPNSGPVRLVTLCWLRKGKNVDLVLDALVGMPGNILYDIYGDGPEFAALQQKIDILGLGNFVTLKGKIDYSDVPMTLSKYDIFVLPSFPETLGRVFLEAMASGLTVVGTRGTGIDGYIENGVSGYLTDLSRKEDLKQILLKIITDDEHRIAISERSRKIAESFHWAKIILKLDEIYKNTIKKYQENCAAGIN